MQLRLTTLAAILLGQLCYGQKRPNIVLINADDLDWAELGCYGDNSGSLTGTHNKSEPEPWRTARHASFRLNRYNCRHSPLTLTQTPLTITEQTTHLMTHHPLARRLPAIMLTLLITAFLLGLGLIIQGIFIEPRKLETTLLDISLPEWSKTKRPASIVALADLHAGPGDENRIRNIVKKTLSLNPEIIVLLGDFAQSHTTESTINPEQIAEALRPLARVPVYYILGNHDYARGAAAFDRAFQAAGFTKMEGQSRIVTFKNGKSIQLSGISDDATYPAHAGSTPPKQNAETPQIVITHSPGAFPFIPAHVDLTLAGHTHGGQICLPGGYPLAPTPTRCTKELMSGYHRHGNKQIYISRGLGTSSLPIRLFCPPEIVHIRLH